MSRRLIAVLVALAIAVATLASSTALGSSASHAKKAKAQKTYTFYLVAGIASDAFYLTMNKGAKAAAAKLGNVKVIFTGSPAAFSPNTQIPFLNGAIARKPDAILIAPTDKTALAAPIQRAISAGIPVETVDTFITKPIAFTNVSTDNVAGGKAAADALVKAKGKSGKVKLVEFDAGPPQVQALKSGTIDALIAQYPYGIGQLGVQLAYKYVTGHKTGIKKH